MGQDTWLSAGDQAEALMAVAGLKLQEASLLVSQVDKQYIVTS